MKKIKMAKFIEAELESETKTESKSESDTELLELQSDTE